MDLHTEATSIFKGFWAILCHIYFSAAKLLELLHYRALDRPPQTGDLSCCYVLSCVPLLVGKFPYRSRLAYRNEKGSKGRGFLNDDGGACCEEFCLTSTSVVQKSTKKVESH